MSLTTMAINASVEPEMRHGVRWHLRLKNAPEFVNEATLSFRSCRDPVYPYAALAGSTQFLTAG